MAATTKVLMSGNSQVVRIPKEFRFTAKEVQIERRGNEIVLMQKRPKSTAFGRRLVRLMRQLPEDFIDALEEIERSDRPPRTREPLD